MSAAFAFVVQYMNRLNLNKFFIGFAILFYALYPAHATYSVSLWSDPLLNVAITLLGICLWEMIRNTDGFFRNCTYITLFMISAITMSLIRNNGIYIFVLTLPALFYVIRKYKLKLAIMCAICVSLFLVMKGPVYRGILHVKPSAYFRYMTIPLQQVNRVTHFHKNDLSAMEQQDIARYFIVSTLDTTYYPSAYDPIVAAFNENNFKTDKAGFFRLWWELGCKHPNLYIEAMLGACYGYWYPEVKYYILSGYTEENYGLHHVKLFPKMITQRTVINFTNHLRNIPVISLIFSIGFVAWLTFLSAAICIFMGAKKYLLIFIPLFVLYLTAIASPAYAEYRFVYAFFTSLPITIALPFLLRSSTTGAKATSQNTPA